MKHFCKRSLAVLLAVLILLGTCEAGVAYAVDEIDKAINPAEQIELTVPEAFADGENWFFIANADWSAGEKSGEKLYIPIQRAGDLNSEAEVTLKVIDLSAKHDVNYTVEVYKEKVTPETAIADLSMVELAQNADGQEEVQLGSENDMGQVLYEVGGADIVDGEGSVVGSISATPMDENGNPIPEPEAETAADEPEAETATDEPEAETAADDGESSDEASEWTEAELSGPAALLAARNAATGTISDRQPLAAPDMTEQALMAGEEFGKDMAAATEDGYPGREYTLRFKAGEDAKFLVITPLYSEAAEGDAQILLMLKNPGEGWAIGENVNPVSVTILDEDELHRSSIDLYRLASAECGRYLADRCDKTACRIILATPCGGPFTTISGPFATMDVAVLNAGTATTALCRSRRRELLFVHVIHHRAHNRHRGSGIEQVVDALKPKRGIILAVIHAERGGIAIHRHERHVGGQLIRGRTRRASRLTDLFTPGSRLRSPVARQLAMHGIIGREEPSQRFVKPEIPDGGAPWRH